MTNIHNRATEDRDEVLCVGNHFKGKKVTQIALSSLLNGSNGDGRVTEIYFRTEDGGLYRISKSQQEVASRLGTYVLTDASLLKDYDLVPSDMDVVLKCGETFCSNGDPPESRVISEIVTVDTSRELPGVYFHSNGIRRYNIKKEFEEAAGYI